MKILTFKRLIGLTAIGGLAYIHKQRGGEWTVASITGTLRDLWSSAVSKLGLTRDKQEERRRSRSRAANLTEAGARETSSADQGSDRGQRKDTPGHP